MDICVTGGAGFIGSHLVERLLGAGHSLLVVDNLSSGHKKNLPQHPKLRFLQKSVLDLEAGDLSESTDAVLHLAAKASVQASWENPQSCHDANLTSTVHLIELIAQLKIPRLAIASSAAVYGPQAQLPVKEIHPTHPASPYGIQKLVSEQYGQLYAGHAGFSFVALRLFNVFGPRQSPDSVYSGVISRFVKAMKEDQEITLFGDGKQSRDFVYVEDVARAFERATTVNLDGGASLICNIGTGKQTSLLQLIDTLHASIPSWGKNVEYKPTRSGDIRHSLADVTEASEHLDWRSEWSLADGLKRYLESSR